MFPPSVSALLPYRRVTPCRRRALSAFARLISALALLFVALLALPLSAVRAELLYGIRLIIYNDNSAANRLVTFDSATPSAYTEITGGDFKSIAFRPSTGQLYAITTYSVKQPGPNEKYIYYTQLHTINLTTNVATALGPAHKDLSLEAIAFNRVDDTLRGVSSSANYTFDPDTGTKTNQGTLRFAAGDVNAGITPTIQCIAYVYDDAGSPTLYGFNGHYNGSTIDYSLFTIGSVGGSPVGPNDGKMFTVAKTAFASNLAVSNTPGVIYANGNTTSGSGGGLHTINLATGEMTWLGNYGGFVYDIAVPPGPPAPDSKWTSVDAAVNRTDNTSRLLWRNTANRYAVWKLSDIGTVQTGKYYGPITGYACDQIVVAPNGETTLLWKNEGTKQVALWTLAPDLSSILRASVYNYPADYTPQRIAADANSNIRMTWRKKLASAVALWTITPSTGAISGSAVYGPYADLFAGGLIAVGADGNVRLVWINKTSGVTLWTLAATYGAPLSTYKFEPVAAGASVARITVGSDNKTRLQWTYASGGAGKIALWKVDTTVGGTGAIEANQSYGPIAHVAPLGLSMGSDNQTRMLWKYATGDKMGRVALWVLNDPLTTITKAYTYGPIY